MGERDAAVIGLDQARRDKAALVGGKAAGLGEMIAAGERVPPGFCVTTTALSSADVPAREITEAYERLGGGPVAVRSSATAEDLPEASFAGQQDTYLNVDGADAVVDAVRRCRDSLDNARAVAYREANEVDRSEARIAVVVQSMVDAATAGVMFTADPLTGSRSRIVVDAVPGLGTGVVDGTAEPDHHVLDGDRIVEDPGGCLSQEQVRALAAAGRRLQRLFRSPQDVEWAHDRDGGLWLLQSRPVTTLFPLPPQDVPDPPRLYMEIGNMQGMLRPFTPLGISLLERVWTRWWRTFGGPDETLGPTPFMVDIGRRLYADITSPLRSPLMRSGLARSMEVYGPRVRAAVEHLYDDPRFAPRPGASFPMGAVLAMIAALLPPIVAGSVRALIDPPAARDRAYSAVDRWRSLRGPGAEAGAAERVEWVLEDAFDTMLGPDLVKVVGPVGAGLLTTMAPAALLRGVASREETDTVLGGAPHNVTMRMNLELWRIAERARAHDELFTATPPGELAERYLRGELPDVGMAEFLDRYGHRTAAEVDIGVPRWREDPTQVFGVIAEHLRSPGGEQAPDRRHARAATAAESMLEELERRAVRARPVRGLLAAFLMRRSRELAGMREYAKFAWLVPFAEMRRQLSMAGEDLASRGLLDRADDLFFLEADELRSAAREGVDQRETVAERRRFHRRELRRRSVPATLLTDGTDVTTTLPRPPMVEGGFPGVPAAPGVVEGRARVVVDPAGARVEPGEILVAPTTDPGWTPLFMTAAGLVSDTGSAIAHGPTVAREYGIPAVVCVPDATTVIRTGDLLRIDGVEGTVTVLEHAPEADG
ncbi:MAG TPA: pyruvate, water dikinase [Nocardiopsis listeri]|uniref:PEP/pyruvate-binding domain-containing protein n=1 Tax=Nocardiopsis listeri TaxID=53440 RepID=UPI001DE40754|nr:PEP/pyruvate-binding domain-containing protein [Nocardiopsis listeri]HJE56906.1 pyruvate, water dikinase [Nocardiopsis listeri]